MQILYAVVRVPPSGHLAHLISQELKFVYISARNNCLFITKKFKRLEGYPKIILPILPDFRRGKNNYL